MVNYVDSDGTFGETSEPRALFASIKTLACGHCENPLPQMGYTASGYLHKCDSVLTNKVDSEEQTTARMKKEAKTSFFPLPPHKPDPFPSHTP